MDGSSKFQGLYKGRKINHRSQRNRLRLSDIESELEDNNSFKPDTGYVSYVEIVKPKQRRRSQPGEFGETRRKNQEGVRRFRGRSNGHDD